MPEIPLDHAGAIGTKLRSARKQRQMSLRDLAAVADISASMLSQIETGKAYPSVRSIYSIAAALAVPVDYFFPDPINSHEGEPAAASAPAGELTASELRETTAPWSTDPGGPTPAGAAGIGDSDDSGAFGPGRAGHTNQLAPAAPAPPVSCPVVHASARPAIELKGGVKWARLTALAEPDAEFLEITYAPGATSGVHMSHHEGREFGLILAGELTVELGFEAYTLRVGDSLIFDSSTPHRLNNKSDQPTRALWVVMSRS
jgi:transcriptional regulator with XRE-family HTH domain/mannose-6-phosphate isomerase-like protein (cupin superfamily)